MPPSSNYKNLVNTTSNYYTTNYPTKHCRKVRNGCFYLNILLILSLFFIIVNYFLIFILYKN